MSSDILFNVVLVRKLTCWRKSGGKREIYLFYRRNKFGRCFSGRSTTWRQREGTIMFYGICRVIYFEPANFFSYFSGREIYSRATWLIRTHISSSIGWPRRSNRTAFVPFNGCNGVWARSDWGRNIRIMHPDSCLGRLHTYGANTAII